MLWTYERTCDLLAYYLLFLQNCVNHFIYSFAMPSPPSGESRLLTSHAPSEPSPRGRLQLSASNVAATTPSLASTVGSYLRGGLLLRLLRGLVSKRKRRFLDSSTGLDLDLSYVSDSLIATGYPSTGLEALYRNPASQLRAFLAARHGLPLCRVWNLCIERGYAEGLLTCSARQALTWYDHTPPPLAYLRPLCEDVQAWSDQSDANVAVVRACQGAEPHARALQPKLKLLCTSSPLSPPPSPLTTARRLQGWQGPHRHPAGSLPSALPGLRHCSGCPQSLCAHPHLQ